MHDKRRGERPPRPQTLAQLQDILLSVEWRHLGQSLTEPRSQLFVGLVGPDGEKSAVFLFPEVVQWLSRGSDLFLDGTMKVVRHLIDEIAQVYSLVTSWLDHVRRILTFSSEIFKRLRATRVERQICCFPPLKIRY